MSQTPRKFTKKEQEQLNKRLAPVYRNIGGLTFSVGLIAILAGLWIDRINNSRPIFTLALVAISVPLVIWINTRMLRRAISKTADKIRQDSDLKK